MQRMIPTREDLHKAIATIAGATQHNGATPLTSADVINATQAIVSARGYTDPTIADHLDPTLLELIKTTERLEAVATIAQALDSILTRELHRHDRIIPAIRNAPIWAPDADKEPDDIADEIKYTLNTALEEADNAIDAITNMSNIIWQDPTAEIIHSTREYIFQMRTVIKINQAAQKEIAAKQRERRADRAVKAAIAAAAEATNEEEQRAATNAQAEGQQARTEAQLEAEAAHNEMIAIMQEDERITSKRGPLTPQLNYSTAHDQHILHHATSPYHTENSNYDPDRPY